MIIMLLSSDGPRERKLQSLINVGGKFRELSRFIGWTRRPLSISLHLIDDPLVFFVSSSGILKSKPCFSAQIGGNATLGSFK